MSYLQNQTFPLNPVTPTNEVGAFISRGGLPVTLDTYVGETFKYLRVRTAGDVNVIGVDGNTILAIDIQPGEWQPILGTGVASSGTTATGIYWYGGQ